MGTQISINGGVGFINGPGGISFPQRNITLPGKGTWTILAQERYKLAPRKKRRKRIQTKIDKRNGRLRHRIEKTVVLKYVNKTERELDPELRKRWIWLGEVYIGY